MIRRLFCALLLAALICGGARAQGLPGDAGALSELVRLQVVAESDAEDAQALKLAVRDACLRAAEVCLGGAQDADEAYARLVEHLDGFRAAAEARARELGFAGSVRVEAGVFEFPNRVYGRLTVPAGEYRALRVTLGAGQGHNWWCVLYPSLCRLNEADAAGSVNLRAALDWLRARLFGGEAA